MEGIHWYLVSIDSMEIAATNAAGIFTSIDVRIGRKSKRKKITPTQGLEGNQCEQFNSLLPIFYFLFAVLYLSMAIFTYNFYFTILS